MFPLTREGIKAWLAHLAEESRMAKKQKQIEAKPTVYRGVTYRSRLEARFACTLDNCTNVLSFKYEPQTFLLPQKGWDYTPDFHVAFFLDGQRANAYIEVKPKIPNRKYRDTCQAFSKVMEYPFWLVAINFHTGECLSIAWHKGRNIIVGMDDIFPNWAIAAQAGNAYRFDL